MDNNKDKMKLDNISMCSTLVNNKSKEQKKHLKFNWKQQFVNNLKIFNKIQYASYSIDPGYRNDIDKK
jgi:hypothetical protein